ncbi:MAG TPA: glycosyltransferase, partial [Gemmatimonadales bacterium]|nr:glycosyltransferase [Gemmatimonadales bacterium]
LTSTADLAPASAVPAFDLLTSPLPAPFRAAATFRLLDITKYFGRDTGGIRTYLLAKSAWLEGNSAAAHLLVVPGVHDDLADGSSRTYRIRGPRMPGQRTYRWLLDGRRLRRILAHERPDLIEVGSSLAVPFVTWRASRGLEIPLVWFYHTHLPRIVNPRGERGPLWRRVAERVAWWHLRRIGRRCSATLASSEAIAKELEAGGVPRVRRVSLGVDLELFTPSRRNGATRVRMQLPDGPIAVYAGRFTPEKQLETVLEAWPGVHRRSNATLILVGHGPAEARLRQHSNPAGIAWLPFEADRARLADLFANADCVIAPGPAETFGLSALEALASGTPVLSVARGGAAELVERSGAGRLYPIGDPVTCAEEALALLGEAATLRDRARRYAESRHAWPVVLGELMLRYREVIAQGERLG